MSRSGCFGVSRKTSEHRTVAFRPSHVAAPLGTVTAAVETNLMNADSKVKILMVDDQPAKLLSYEVILSELGENLIKATSAGEALSLLLKNDIAVVLMDVRMPDLGGFELADVIRQPPR